MRLRKKPAFPKNAINPRLAHLRPRCCILEDQSVCITKKVEDFI